MQVLKMPLQFVYKTYCTKNCLKEQMRKKEKLWMIYSMLDKNKTSKPHAFTKETLYDDGDWFKSSPKQFY